MEIYFKKKERLIYYKKQSNSNGNWIISIWIQKFLRFYCNCDKCDMLLLNFYVMSDWINADTINSDKGQNCCNL